MSNTNGVIAAPVSIYDVQHVLGQGSNDLATLCVSTAINRWARYKPERWAGTTAAQKLLGWPQPMSYAARKINNFSLDVPYLITDLNKGWTHDVMAKRVYDIINRVSHTQGAPSEDQLAWQYLKGLDTNSATAGSKGGVSFDHRPDSVAVWIKRTGPATDKEDFHILY